MLLANTLSRVHESYSTDEYWPGTTSQLTSVEAATRFKTAMSDINTIYRSSSAIITLERGFDPLREAIGEIEPRIETMAKERGTQLIDFDSYKRRLKGLREKRETLESQGKANTTAGQENLADITKFEAKEHVARELYEQKNEALKNDIIEARAAHDMLMNDALVSIIVTQAELFKAAAAKLEEVIQLLPADKVEEMRAAVQMIVGQGGVQVVKEEKTKMQKGVAIFTGKALPSDFKNKDAVPMSTAEPVFVGMSTSLAGGRSTANGRSASMIALPSSASKSINKDSGANPFASSGNPFSVDDTSNAPPPFKAPSTSAPPPAPPAAAPPAPPVSKKVTVVALYDHEAEADDELNFKTGDIVEVLETGDDGWWKGRCHGQVGLFPVNYVEAQP